MIVQGNNVSVALRMGEFDGDIKVIIGIHDGDEETAWVAIPSEVAAQVAIALTARAVEARALENEIAAIPMDDRADKLPRIWDRLNSPQN
jgi:hypothetical protein